jgi:MFS family permease
MQTIAQAWLVYRLTRSPFYLGAVGFAGQFPVLLLAPAAGLVVDRYSRRDVVMATQFSAMVLAFGLALVTLAGTVQVWQIFGFALLLGVVNAFDTPARQSFLIEMVGREDLMNAIALNSAMFNSARLLGPAIAGILVVEIGEGWCFFANAASYVAAIAGLHLMRLPVRERRQHVGSMQERLLEGIRYVRHTRPVRDLLLLLGLSGLLLLPVTVLMPLFADRVLHSGPRGLGFLMAALGLGAVLGTLLLAARRDIVGLERSVVLACAGGGVSLVFFSYCNSLWPAAALLVPAGLCMLLQMSSSNTLIQAMVPDQLRGRVMSVYSMMFLGVPPIGAMLQGALADRVGPRLMVSSSATIAVIGAFFFSHKLSAISSETRRLTKSQVTSADG